MNRAADTTGTPVEAWWAAWWDADYSWEGLATKEIGRNGDIVHGTVGANTLQEYWRRDYRAGGSSGDDAWLRHMGALVTVDDVEFHIAHLPPVGRRGTRTWKSEPTNANWQLLEDLIAHNANAVMDSRFDSLGHPTSPDGRAQFQGTVLYGAPRLPDAQGGPLRLNLHQAAILGPWRLTQRPFGPECRLDKCLFVGDVDVQAVGLQGPVHFSGTRFCGDVHLLSSDLGSDARFDEAVFEGRVDFTRTRGSGDFTGAIFLGVATFTDTQLGGSVFARTRFREGADFARSGLQSTIFDQAEFGGLALFSRTDLSGHFDAAKFARHADFSGATFAQPAEFYSAEFRGDVNFAGASFQQTASFDDAVFAGEAQFDRATFTGSASFQSTEFSRTASFIGAEFHAQANFNDSAWAGDARFNDCRFIGQVVFDDASLSGTSAFDGAVFSDLVRFHRTRFLETLSFHTAVFEKPAYFHRITWPGSARGWHGAFRQTLFERQASFTGSGFRAFAAFDGATLKGGIRLDEVSEAAAKGAYFAEERSATEDVLAGDTALTSPTISRDERLRELERGCRVLKQVMAQSADAGRAQLLHQFELRARRRQTDVSSTERAFSRLYAWTSDYGGSLVRPFGWLVGLVLGFTTIFFALCWAQGRIGAAVGQIPCWPASVQALELALLNVLKPLAIFTASTAGKAPMATAPQTLADILLDQTTPALALSVKLLGSLESLLAIILVFLFGLALRRRFQVG